MEDITWRSRSCPYSSQFPKDQTQQTKKNSGRIYRRISAIVAVILVITMILSIIACMSSVQNITRSNTSSSLHTIATDNKQLLNDMLEEQSNNIILIGNALAMSGREDRDWFVSFLASAMPLNSDAMNYYICSEADRSVFAADGSDVPIDPTERPWWDTAIKAGKDACAFTEPYVDAVSGSMVISVSHVLSINEHTYVILADISLKTFCNIVNSIGDDNAAIQAWLLGPAGDIITHPYEAFLPTETKATIFTEVCDIDIHPTTDTTKYIDQDGVSRYYATEVLSNGWTLGVSQDDSNVKSFMIKSLMSTMLLIAGSIAVFIVVLMIGLKRSLSPMGGLAIALEAASRGDFSKPIPKTHYHDDVSILQESVTTLIKTLESIIGDSNRILGSLSNCDLTVHDMQQYPGVFNEMSQSINNVKNILRSLLTNMHSAACSVNTGSTQLAAAADSLASGATAQAGSISSLESHVSTMADRINNNASQCDMVSTRITDLTGKITESSNELHQLYAAVEDVQRMSEDIGKIVGAINNIAFQTNILALNASVEASRAGEAGHGFSVVAGEVRNLAAKCAEESHKTEELINACLASITAAKSHADVTVSFLDTVCSDFGAVDTAFHSISDDTSGQAKDAELIHEEIRSISDIVQTNTATSEETAASSRELTRQAQNLAAAVGKFKL